MGGSRVGRRMEGGAGGRWGRDSEQTSSAPAPGITGQDRDARERRLRGKRAVGSEGLARDLDLSPHGGRPWGTVCHYHSQLEASPAPRLGDLGKCGQQANKNCLGEEGDQSFCAFGFSGLGPPPWCWVYPEDSSAGGCPCSAVGKVEPSLGSSGVSPPGISPGLGAGGGGGCGGGEELPYL